MMKDSVRLFLALPVDEHYHTVISKFTGQQEIPKIRWISPENWHVTVLFLGDFPSHHIPALINSLKDFFKNQHAFSLQFDKFIYKPKQEKPTMIWGRFLQNSYFDLLCRRMADHLESLYFDLNLSFSMSIHSENIPHITLSRLKTTLISYPGLNCRGIAPHQPKLRCDFCTLYQSELTTEGAKYSKLAEFKLN